MDLEISLAQWSLHRSLYAGELDHLDFAKISKENFGIDAIDSVNSFFFEKAPTCISLSNPKDCFTDNLISGFISKLAVNFNPVRIF